MPENISIPNEEEEALLALSKKWLTELLSKPETGMGYQVVSVLLKDGRRFDRVGVNSGYITRIKDMTEIPFAEEDIQEIIVTHDKWNFKQK
jgi:hypothetical protein